MARSKSSKRWLEEHFSDAFVKKAQKEGYRSRSVYKLFEIHEKDKIIKKGMTVVDLGSAPGGWSQMVRKILGPTGKVLALDILPMDPLPGVTFIQGDFAEEKTLNELLSIMKGEHAHAVLSDIAPNLSGIAVSDQAKSMYLAELALDFAKKVLVSDGIFLVKVFQGTGFDSYLKDLRQHFKRVKIRKPLASRDRSKEMYLLAEGFKAYDPP